MREFCSSIIKSERKRDTASLSSSVASRSSLSEKSWTSVFYSAPTATRLLTGSLIAVALASLSLAPFFAVDAWAQSYIADEICGDGVDNDNSAAAGFGHSNTGHAAGDTLCTGDDKDNDGFIASLDCDDTNRYIFPSDYSYWTTGCSGGQVRKCQAGGTWSSCAAWSCPAGRTCYYIDPAGSDSAAGTSTGTAWASLQPLRNSCGSGTCHTPAAGDIYLLRGGTYTSATSTYINSKDGTSGNPIVVMAYPGEVPVIDMTGTTDSYWLETVACDYWHVEGIKFQDSHGDMIYSEGGDNWVVRRNWCESTRGLAANNKNCFKFSDYADNIEIANNVIYDSPAMIFFRGTGIRAHHNVCFGDGTNNRGYCGAFKHGAAGATFEYDHNVVFNLATGAIGIWSAQSGSHIHHNIFHDVDEAINAIGDPGGPSYLENWLVEYNTIIDSQNPFHLERPQLATAISAIRFENNTIVDTTSVIHDLESTQSYATYSPYIDFDANCYYDSGNAALTNEFQFFSGGSGGLMNFATWQGLGQDTTGYNTNPTLDVDLMPDAASCIGKGWRQGLEASEITTKGGLNFRAGGRL